MNDEIKLGSRVRCVNGRFLGSVGIVTYFHPENHKDAFCMMVQDIPERVNPGNWRVIESDPSIEEIKQLKMKAEEDILQIVKNLRNQTSCNVDAVSLTTEEGFGFAPVVMVTIKLSVQ